MNCATKKIILVLLEATRRADPSGKVLDEMFDTLDQIADPQDFDGVSGYAYVARSMIEDIQDNNQDNGSSADFVSLSFPAT